MIAVQVTVADFAKIVDSLIVEFEQQFCSKKIRCGKTIQGDNTEKIAEYYYSLLAASMLVESVKKTINKQMPQKM